MLSSFNDEGNKRRLLFFFFTHNSAGVSGAAPQSLPTKIALRLDKILNAFNQELQYNQAIFIRVRPNGFLPFTVQSYTTAMLSNTSSFTNLLARLKYIKNKTEESLSVFGNVHMVFNTN